ncbi:MAG: hypothetical protein CM15mP129_03590 [Chloroflexota bacterium]|nr:MAG: hypothetical protein CM15mP129_03590 [Chloroflexota bacterium]
MKKTTPAIHKIKDNGLNKLSPNAANIDARANIGNNEALVNPPLVIAKTHLINLVVNLIGILTSSSIGIVMPQ